MSEVNVDAETLRRGDAALSHTEEKNRRDVKWQHLLCRRLSKSGFNCSSKSGRGFTDLKAVLREDVWPLRLLRRGRAGNDPEAVRLLHNGDLLGFAGRDLPASTQETDLSGFLHHSGVVGREMQIE